MPRFCQNGQRRALTANLAGFFANLFAFLLVGGGPPITLATLMILKINLVLEGWPAFSLGVDLAEQDVMKMPPRGRGEPLFVGGQEANRLKCVSTCVGRS
ncbi:cation transporting ATPase C-terminal domain-containing protein [Shimia sp. SDUM112013]|uniref:cation transporting ATPase C-terminal domain-containing protein n=1 Tax=Shimia sp. SDUM112013 TaxID=3136160 RepID=UPI0032EF79CB